MTENDRFKLHLGKSQEVLREYPDNYFDSVVCDPPYHLTSIVKRFGKENSAPAQFGTDGAYARASRGFMGKEWDGGDIAFRPEFWAEVFRVLKPGGHLLAFSGSRTYHRMACGIEDAGFEIRDQIMWLYGSGFPKSHDVSKGIDRANGECGRFLKFTQWFRKTGITRKQATDAMVAAGHISANGTMAGHYFAETLAGQPAIPTRAIWSTLRSMCGDVPAWVDELVERIEAERDVIGQKTAGIANPNDTDRHTIGGSSSVTVSITAPATEAAKQWQGWGSALKPAHEPIVVARKPLIGTIAENVLTYGTGALNIDGCRVGNDALPAQIAGQAKIGTFERGEMITPERFGRWPANVIHDGSDEATAGFPQDMGASAARFFYCAKTSKEDRDEGLDGFEFGQTMGGGGLNNTDDDVCGKYGSIKAPSRNTHPTVKPTDLMRYLCRMVTPPDGIVLDPFMGSGSTGKAAMLEGFRFVGIDMTPEYLDIARARIQHAHDSRHNIEALIAKESAHSPQMSLFDAIEAAEMPQEGMAEA